MTIAHSYLCSLTIVPILVLFFKFIMTISKFQWLTTVNTDFLFMGLQVSRVASTSGSRSGSGLLHVSRILLVW